MQVTFTHSHAFEGGRAHVVDEAEIDPCLVEFADGVVVVATVTVDGDDILLDVPSYRTAAGNTVAARSWRMHRSDEGMWRVRQRA